MSTSSSSSPRKSVSRKSLTAPPGLSKAAFAAASWWTPPISVCRRSACAADQRVPPERYCPSECRRSECRHAESRDRIDQQPFRRTRKGPSAGSYPPQRVAPAGNLKLSLPLAQCRLETSLGPMQCGDVFERAIQAAAESRQARGAECRGLGVCRPPYRHPQDVRQTLHEQIVL